MSMSNLPAFLGFMIMQCLLILSTLSLSLHFKGGVLLHMCLTIKKHMLFLILINNNKIVIWLIIVLMTGFARWVSLLVIMLWMTLWVSPGVQFDRYHTREIFLWMSWRGMKCVQQRREVGMLHGFRDLFSHDYGGGNLEGAREGFGGPNEPVHRYEVWINRWSWPQQFCGICDFHLQSNTLNSSTTLVILIAILFLEAVFDLHLWFAGYNNIYGFQLGLQVSLNFGFQGSIYVFLFFWNYTYIYCFEREIFVF